MSGKRDTPFDLGWNMAESFDQHRKERENLTDCAITFNGQPLSEFISRETGLEITGIRIEIIGKLSKAVSVVHAPKTKRSGIGSGRGSGNPGVKKGRRLTPAEVEAENLRRGFVLNPKKEG